MLKTLSLTNFQRHAALTVNFEAGLNLICGANWAGKSTVLRGVLFALFGGSAVPIKNELLVRRGEKSLSVELSFKIGGETYRVVRNKSGARLASQRGDILASGQTPVTEKVQDLIGMSAQEFLTFNNTSQREAASLLGLGANRIGQHLAAATGVDLVDKVLARARTAATEAKGALGTLKSMEVAQGVAAWQTEARTRQDECAGLANAKATLDSQLVDATRALAAGRARLAERVEEEREGREKLRLWGQMLRDLEVSGAVLKQHLSSRPPEVEQGDVYAAQALADAASDGLQKLQRWVQARSELAVAVASSKAALGQYEAWFKATTRPTKGELEAAEERYAGLTASRSKACLQAAGLKDMLFNGVCEACGRPFEEGYDRADLESRLAQAEAEAAALLLPIKAAQDSGKDLEKLAGDYDRYARDSDWHVVALADLEHKLDALGPQPPAVAAEDAERERRRWLDVMAQADAWGIWSRRLKELENSFAEAQRNAASRGWELEISETAVQEISDDVAAQRKDVDRLTQYHSSVWHHAETTGAALKTAQERLQEAKKGLEQAQLTLDKLRETEERATKLGALVRYLGDNRDRYLATLWDQLLGFSSAFVQEATSGKITEIKRTGEGSFAYVEEGQEMPVELASGYQGAVLGVAVKLALSAALGAQGGVMLFDEVTADASDENALLLTSLLARAGNQVVLVSHRSADGAAADSVIELG